MGASMLCPAKYKGGWESPQVSNVAEILIFNVEVTNYWENIDIGRG